jgi:hypothetical protein
MSDNQEHDDIVDMILKILVDKQLSGHEAMDIANIVQREIRRSVDSAWDRPLTINK